MSTRIEKCQGRLTVYFEDPFWVGVFERIENGKLSAAKVTFGAEPKDYEVGIGTKSQQALKLQQEQNKLVRKERSKMERVAESDRLFELKQQKKKEKHKGH